MKNKLPVEVKTIYGTHVVILEPDPEGGYVVTSNQCPELTTWGKNVAEAKKWLKKL